MQEACLGRYVSFPNKTKTKTNEKQQWHPLKGAEMKIPSNSPRVEPRAGSAELRCKFYLGGRR